jgi:hypothetical protein
MTDIYTRSPFTVRGLTTQAVLEVLMREPIRPWTVKQICTELGLTHEEKDLKDVSNRCGYIRSDGGAKRIAQGTYVLNEKGNPMSDQYVDTGAATVPEPTAPEQPAPGVNPMQCPECAFVARSDMGLKAHKTRSHSTGKISADEMFERIGTACEALFPEGIPMSRIMEVAELQKQMLKTVTRR